jgi:hypothetical protein
MGGEMSRSSTLYELIMADIREANAMARWQRNQPDRRTLKQMLYPKKKRCYRRDRVLRKLCDIQMKFFIINGLKK